MTTTPQVQDLELNKPELEELSKGVALVVQETLAITKIDNDLTYQKVCKMGLDAAANIKNIEALLDPICDQRYAHWKRATSVRSERTGPFVQIKERCSVLVGAYDAEKKKAAAREELRLRIQAQKEAGAQNAAEAQQLFDEGREAEALAMLERNAVPVMPIMVTDSAPKVKGVSSARQKFVGRVTDFLALIKAIGKGKVPTVVVSLNQTKLDQFIALDPKKQIDGVEVVEVNKAGFRG